MNALEEGVFERSACIQRALIRNRSAANRFVQPAKCVGELAYHRHNTASSIDLIIVTRNPSQTLSLVF
jgi:hypothetical protein